MKPVQMFITGAVLLSGVCRGAVDLTIAWNPSLTDINGQTLAAAPGYKLFFSESSGVYSEYVDAGTSATVAVPGLEYNKTYFFKAKAYTPTGESAYSEEFTWTAPAMPDADTDRLSDDWELKHFNTLNQAQVTDYDGDGSSDLKEFLAGTNPADPDDYPRIAIHAAPAGVTLSFQAKQAAGDGYENRARYYTLMQCENLTSGIWTGVPGKENILAADQTVSCASSPDSRRAFYRTEVRLN